MVTDRTDQKNWPSWAQKALKEGWSPNGWEPPTKSTKGTYSVSVVERGGSSREWQLRLSTVRRRLTCIDGKYFEIRECDPPGTFYFWVGKEEADHIEAAIEKDPGLEA